MLTKVTLCGSELKFRPIRNSNSKSISKKIRQSKSSSTLPGREYKGRTTKKGEKLYRTSVKSRKWFLKTMSQIENTPNTFITATFPVASKACERVKLAKKYFYRFVRNVRKQFPNCYLIWKLETRQGRGIHFHILAKFRGNGLTRADVYKILEKEWESMFRMSFEGEKIFKVEKYKKERHEGYLVKKSKFAEEMRCKTLLQGKRGWGIIGKKNIRFYEEKNFSFTPKEYKRMARYLKRYIAEHPELSEQYDKQLSHSAGSLYLFPPEELEKAIKYATARRRTTEHDA